MGRGGGAAQREAVGTTVGVGRSGSTPTGTAGAVGTADAAPAAGRSYRIRATPVAPLPLPAAAGRWPAAAPGSRPRLLLVDGHALAWRAFYGLSDYRTGLRGADGTPGWAVHGFLTVLAGVLAAERPDRVVVAFDAGRSVRADVDPTYKAQRPAVPDELRHQLRLLRRLVEASGLECHAIPGTEADDVIGTLAARRAAAGDDVLILTHDADQFQLVGPHVTVLRLAGPDPVGWSRMGQAEVAERYGFPPDRIPDYKALAGDASDNIPGVRGIGEKSAKALIVRWGTLEAMLDAIEAVEPARVRELLRAEADIARRCKGLATIVRNAPVEEWPSALDPRDLFATPAVGETLAACGLDALAHALAGSGDAAAAAERVTALAEAERLAALAQTSAATATTTATVTTAATTTATATATSAGG